MEVEQRWWTMDRRNRLRRRRFRRRGVQNRPWLLSHDLLPHFAASHRLFMCLRKNDVFREQPQKPERTDSTRDIWRSEGEPGLPIAHLAPPPWLFLLFGLFREIKRRRGSSTRRMPAGWRPRYLGKNWTTSSTRYAVRSLDTRRGRGIKPEGTLIRPRAQPFSSLPL